MKNYADESNYSDYLSGKKAVITTAFAYYARQATSLINRYTHGNITGDNIPDEVKMCCCELAELICSSEASEAAKKQGIASESVQGWSQSYESSEARETALRNAQKECIYKWLSNTGLLYSGVRRC